MISDKEIVCPNNLLNVAHKKKGVVAGIVNAGKPLPMLSVVDAVNEDLIIPTFIGDQKAIEDCAADLKFDISKYQIVHEPDENTTAKVAAKFTNVLTFPFLLGGCTTELSSIFALICVDIGPAALSPAGMAPGVDIPVTPGQNGVRTGDHHGTVSIHKHGTGSGRKFFELQ